MASADDTIKAEIMQEQNRQLAAILFTDIVGYTALMQQDEQKAVMVTRHYITVLNLSVAAHHGKILNDYGDGSLCSFSSATEAMHCAIEVQQQLQNEPRVPLRIGLHVGELFFEGDKVMGDGVNVASRIQSLGIANSILFSSEINSKLKNQQDFKSVSVGRFEFKNVDEPMEVFALANEGLVVPKKEEMSGKLKEIQKKSVLRKWIIAAGIVLLLTASYFIYQLFNSASGFSGEKSIAILPFKVSGNSEDALSNGLVEDILARLMKIKEIKVISNRSSVLYADSKKSPKEIGEELNVNSLMMGSIQQIGNRIKVSAQVIDSKTGDMIWTEVYDRDKIQIFDLQTELANRIVNGLKANLSSEEKKDLSSRYTENVEAYKLYRKGRWFGDKRTTASYDSAELNYKKAIELDPDYALAYVGLAELYTLPQNGMLQVEGMPIAKKYVMQALSLDSNLSEALTTLGFIQSAYDYDWEKSKHTLEKAIALNPNYSIAHRYYGNLLQYTGESTERGLKEIIKALELDPLSSADNWVLGRNYYFAGKIDSSYEQLKKTLALDPGNIRAKGSLALVLLIKKKYSEAFDIIRQLPVSGTSNTIFYQGALLSYAYAVSGDSTRAYIELNKTIKEFPLQSPYFLAVDYINLKYYDEGFTLLEKAYKIRDIGMYFLKAEPELSSIRNDTRFKALLKKMNLE